jgi:hypothetical protein
MIETVQKLFGDTSEAQIDRPFILSQLNLGQIEVARQTKVLAARAEAALAAGVDSYDVPDDFIQIESVKVDGVVVTPIPRSTLDLFDPARDAIGSGTPFSYHVRGRTIFLFPKPSSSVTNALDIWYIKKPSELVTDDDVCNLPETMHNAVILFALEKCKVLDEEFAQAQVIRADFNNQLVAAKDEAYDTNAESYPSVRLLPEDY